MKSRILAFRLLVVYWVVIGFFACQSKKYTESDAEQVAAGEATYTNPLLDVGPDPYAFRYQGKYYYTQNSEDHIMLWETSDLTDLRNARKKTVWNSRDEKGIFHVWAPELHRINHKWYLYFSADNGHMDNQRIYVMENAADSPFDGKFVHKGQIKTDKDDNWAIQPNVFSHQGKWYMVWCGRPDHRTDQVVQEIYIASMENPWTLGSERVLLSRPDFEWERQWISPDGNKSDRPSLLNEAPQFLRSPNGEKLFIFFCGSGSWTPYYCIGLLTADADSDLLNPLSWKKSSEPVLMQNSKEQVYGPGSPSFVTSPDGNEYYILYHARTVPNDGPGALDSRSPRLQKMYWDENNMPIMPVLKRTGTQLAKPSGTQF